MLSLLCFLQVQKRLDSNQNKMSTQLLEWSFYGPCNYSNQKYMCEYKEYRKRKEKKSPYPLYPNRGIRISDLVAKPLVYLFHRA